eukprot:865709-Pyramimonas_sp.AAC.1
MRPCEPCHWRLRWTPHGATIRVKGVPKWPEAAMRTLPLGPPIEFPWGHDPREECTDMGWGCHANTAIEAFGGAPMWGSRSS